MSETTLILSVIGRAVEDMKADLAKIRSKEIKTEAVREKEHGLKWLLSDSEKVRGFCWYCRLLELDPQWIRRKLKLTGKGRKRKNDNCGSL